MTKSNKNVPSRQVLPSFIQYLPLREDFDENQAIFKSFAVVYQQGNDVLLPLIDRITAIGLAVLAKKQYSEDGKRLSFQNCVILINNLLAPTETRDIVTSFVRQVSQDFPDKFQAAANSDPEILAFTQQNFN